MVRIAIQIRGLAIVIGFLLVVSFPLIAGIVYGLTYYALSRFVPGSASGVLARWGGEIHIFLLVVPTIGVLRFVLLDRTAAFPGQLGITLPTFSSLPLWLVAALCILIAIVLGRLLFLQELVLSVQLRRIVGQQSKTLGAAVDGQSSQLTRHVPPLAHYMATSAAIVLLEEFLWRGFLIYFLIRYMHFPLVGAILLAALSFGLNHANFGLRNVVLKAIDGAVWGLLLVATSSLLAPIVSHLTFQYYVWRRLDRQAGATR